MTTLVMIESDILNHVTILSREAVAIGIHFIKNRAIRELAPVSFDDRMQRAAADTWISPLRML